MKRKTWTLVITYTLAIIVVLGGFVIQYASQAAAYRDAERHAQMHAVSQLSDSLAQMSNTLLKGMYAGSPELLASVSAEIWNHSAAAIASMASLPLSDVSLEQTETFISRVGDYTYYITRRAASHTDLSEEERQALASLSETADMLSQNVLTLESDLYTGTVTFEADRSGELASAVQNFSAIEEEFPEYVSVDYDGKMSAHIGERLPLSLENAEEIDLSTAYEKAAAALCLDVDSLSFSGESGGTIPAYHFSTENGAYVTVCKQGGAILSARNTCTAQAGEIGMEKALEIAKNYLTTIGYDGMRQAWYHRDGDTVTFRFVYEDQGIMVYPDMITVGVSLLDGEIMSLNAEDYVMNHHERVFKEPAVSQNEAAAGISNELEVTFARRAIILSSGMYETDCYEFLCRTEEGQEMLLYCDVETGKQCKLSLLNRTEDGIIFS